MLVTAPRPEPRLAIDVQGQLRLEGPTARAVTLSADGSQLRLEAPEWEDLHGLGPISLLAQRRTLATMTAALRKLSLRLDVNVAGRRAFGLGAGVKTTLLARLMGLSAVDVRISNVVSLLRSRAAARHVDRR